MKIKKGTLTCRLILIVFCSCFKIFFLQIGALLVTTNKELTPHDGDLTKMGLIMAKLPLDVRLSKLIFMGNLFNVLGDCIIIGKIQTLRVLTLKNCILKFCFLLF